MIGTYFYVITARDLTGGFQIIAWSNTWRISPLRSHAQKDLTAAQPATEFVAQVLQQQSTPSV